VSTGSCRFRTEDPAAGFSSNLPRRQPRTPVT